jgi:hypothetical protein
MVKVWGTVIEGLSLVEVENLEKLTNFLEVYDFPKWNHCLISMTKGR